MLLHSYFLLPLLVLNVTLIGCAGSKVSTENVANRLADPIMVKSADLTIALIKIAEQGSEETLIEDPGWLEYIIEIENLSTSAFTVQNVKLLNQDGRYVDSASDYEQITAPPDVGAELAGDVVETVAVITASQVIPYGGTIYSLFSNAASVSSAKAKENAKQVFMLRVLKNVELAPTGKLEGSAFLPDIKSPKKLVVDYNKNGTTSRIEVPLAMQ